MALIVPVDKIAGAVSNGEIMLVVLSRHKQNRIYTVDPSILLNAL